MHRSARLAGPAFLAALAACTGMTGDGEGVGGLLAGGDACGAGQYESYVGQRVDALNDVALPDDARVLFPGSVVTQDLREARLNIDVDTDDTITRVYCG